MKKGYYVLSGVKIWIMNSFIVDVFMVWVKLQEIGKIRGFLIERKDCLFGIFEILVIKNKNGLRVSIMGMIQMEDCFVFEVNMFFEVEGFCGFFSCFNSVCYGIVFGVMGVFEDCIV